MFDFVFDLQLFADSGSMVNTTTGQVDAYTGAATTTNDMTPGMKTFYDTALLENAREEAVYGQLGKQQSLPAHHGKTVEWRKWNTLPEPDKLQEGVIPEGKKFGQTATNVTIAQYGEYVTVSDQLELHHVDDTILGATEEVGAAMGKKADRLTRDAILAGATNVLYAPNESGTPATIYEVDGTSRFTPDMVARAVTVLKKANTPTIDGKYVAVIHPSVAYDLRKDPAWISYHQYDASTEIFNGEIGELHGVRFVEATNAPVMVGEPLFNATQRYLSVDSGAAAISGTAIENGFGLTGAYAITVSENLANAEVDYSKLVGQYILLEKSGAVSARSIVTGVDSAAKIVYVSENITAASGNFLLPGNGGAESKAANEQVAVYATMIFGRDAFGVVAPEGAGMEMIIKSKGQVGGPLEQFSTVGGKMSHAAKALYPERYVTVFSGSEYSGTDEANWHM